MGRNAKSLTVEGKTYKSIEEACKDYNMSINTYYSRIRNGMTPDDALTNPAGSLNNVGRKPTLVTVEGKTYKSVEEACKDYNMNVKTYYSRVKNGMTIEDALMNPAGSLNEFRKLEKIINCVDEQTALTKDEIEEYRNTCDVSSVGEEIKDVSNEMNEQEDDNDYILSNKIVHCNGWLKDITEKYMNCKNKEAYKIIIDHSLCILDIVEEKGPGSLTIHTKNGIVDSTYNLWDALDSLEEILANLYYSNIDAMSAMMWISCLDYTIERTNRDRENECVSVEIEALVDTNESPMYYDNNDVLNLLETGDELVNSIYRKYNSSCPTNLGKILIDLYDKFKNIIFVTPTDVIQVDDNLIYYRNKNFVPEINNLLDSVDKGLVDITVAIVTLDSILKDNSNEFKKDKKIKKLKKENQRLNDALSEISDMYRKYLGMDEETRKRIRDLKDNVDNLQQKRKDDNLKKNLKKFKKNQKKRDKKLNNHKKTYEE